MASFCKTSNADKRTTLITKVWKDEAVKTEEAEKIGENKDGNFSSFPVIK